MTAATRQGGRAANEYIDPERLAPTDRRRVMDANPAVDLVVKADLPVQLVLVAGKLHSVHPQIGAPDRAGLDPRYRPGAK